jgi:hypothetical protein
VEPRGFTNDSFHMDISLFLSELLNGLLCANLRRLYRENVAPAFAALNVRQVQ